MNYELRYIHQEFKYTGLCIFILNTMTVVKLRKKFKNTTVISKIS